MARAAVRTRSGTLSTPFQSGRMVRASGTSRIHGHDEAETLGDRASERERWERESRVWRSFFYASRIDGVRAAKVRGYTGLWCIQKGTVDWRGSEDRGLLPYAD